MSFDKAIEHGKEHRKQYRGWALCDRTMCNHGSDWWGTHQRTHFDRKNRSRVADAVLEYGGP